MDRSIRDQQIEKIVNDYKRKVCTCNDWQLMYYGCGCDAKDSTRDFVSQILEMYR